MTRAAKGPTRYLNVAAKPSHDPMCKVGRGSSLGKEVIMSPSLYRSWLIPHFVCGFMATSVCLGCAARRAEYPKAGAPADQLFVPSQPARVMLPQGNKDGADEPGPEEQAQVPAPE